MDLDAALAVAKDCVAAAGTAALAHLRKGIVVETKPDLSPVTAADRDAEDEIVRIIRASFPDHAILARRAASAPAAPRPAGSSIRSTARVGSRAAA
jgi:histidinol-phosphatase